MLSYQAMRHEWITTDEAETILLAEKIGQSLRGGETLLLKSDVGGGKTTFTKGVARGLGIEDMIGSPTFTIENEYLGRLRLRHYDLYRLSETGLMQEELQEALQEQDSVKVIEWPTIVQNALEGSDYISVTIERMKEGDTYRRLFVDYPDRLDYVFDSREEAS